MLLAGFIFLAIVVAGISVAGYYLLRFPERGLPGRLNVRDLGRIEGALPALQRVIVIADQVEDPADELRKAVKKNLANGVHYLFLISKSRGQMELDGYYRILRRSPQSSRDTSKQMGQERWISKSYPTIGRIIPTCFMKLKTRQAASFVAFRGNERKEGIAEFYSPVDARYAYTIARAVLSEAPQQIQVTADQFPDGSNVVGISTKEGLTKSVRRG